jgi:nucleotide-binding universal stress UspA family protein
VRKILVPTDFSPNALTAYQYAVALAVHFGADLILAHVIKRLALPANTPLEVYETVLEDEKQRAWEELKRQAALKRESLGTNQDIRVIPLVVLNAFVTGINQLVAQENPSLIIMGTKGATGLRRIFLGSNTADLIDHTIVPLLAVPEKYAFASLQKILIALNIKEYAGVDCLHLLRSIVRVFSSSVTILTVLQGEEPAGRKDEIKAEVEEALQTSVAWVEAKSKNVVPAIQEYVEANEQDLLVLLPQPKNIWRQIFSTSPRYEFVFKPQIPVLVIPTLVQEL